MDEEYFDRGKADEIKYAVQDLLDQFDGKTEKQVALREVVE